jgi:hypothetical protein
MKPKKGAAKVNISMPKELFDYLKKEVEEHNAKPENLHCPTDFSKMVQKAIWAMMAEERATVLPGQAMPDRIILNNDSGNAPAQPHSGRNIIEPSETSVGGYSTARSTTYRKTGKAK